MRHATILRRFCLVGTAVAGLMVASTGHAEDLRGEWVKPCALDENYDLYRLERLVFADGEVLITKEFSVEPGCEVKDFIFSGKATYKVGGADPSVAGARQIDFVFSEVQGIVHTDSAVSSFNEISVCGLRGWTKDKPQDVQGRVCERSIKNPLVGATVYHIFKIDGAKFYSGDHYSSAYFNGSAPDRRPNQLSLSDPFYKQ